MLLHKRRTLPVCHGQQQYLKSRYHEISNGQGTKVSSVTSKEGISPDLLGSRYRKRREPPTSRTLGDAGVGETTFVRRLVRIDAKKELENSIVLYVDFGSQPALRRDLETFVSENFAKQLLENDRYLPPFKLLSTNAPSITAN